MRRILFILLFLPSLLFGQDTLFHWTGSFNWSDSTLINNIDNEFEVKINNLGYPSSYYIKKNILPFCDKAYLFFDELFLSYANDEYDSNFFNSNVFLNNGLHENINYSDFIFCKIKNQVLASDSSEVTPSGVSEILILSLPATGNYKDSLYSYFDVINIGANSYFVALDSGGVGGDGSRLNPYKSMVTAENVKGVNDTLVLLSGSETFSATLTTEANIRGCGMCTLKAGGFCKHLSFIYWL